jgi:hypothetical protein
VSEPELIADAERWEAFMVMVRRPTEGPSWFDRVHALISADCKGSETEPCTCGLETMGGTEGTYDQCMKYLDPTQDDGEAC